MKRGSKAIFSVILWKPGSYVAPSDSGAINTFKDLHFLPGTETHLRVMTLPAASLLQRGAIGKSKEQSTANETVAKSDVHASSKSNNI